MLDATVHMFIIKRARSPLQWIDLYDEDRALPLCFKPTKIAPIIAEHIALLKWTISTSQGSSSWVTKVIDIRSSLMTTGITHTVHSNTIELIGDLTSNANVIRSHHLRNPSQDTWRIQDSHHLRNPSQELDKRPHWSLKGIIREHTINDDFERYQCKIHLWKYPKDRFIEIAWNMHSSVTSS